MANACPLPGTSARPDPLDRCGRKDLSGLLFLLVAAIYRGEISPVFSPISMRYNTRLEFDFHESSGIAFPKVLGLEDETESGMVMCARSLE